MRRSTALPISLPAFTLVLVLAGCAGPAPIERGETQIAPMHPAELAQSDVNRMATLGMRDNLDSLLRIADKLYRRNPSEWRKTGAASREVAMAQLRLSLDSPVPWPSKPCCRCWTNRSSNRY